MRFVKETQAISRPPLILSGWGAQQVMRAASEEGVAAVIKPVDSEEFLSTLEELPVRFRKRETQDGQFDNLPRTIVTVSDNA